MYMCMLEGLEVLSKNSVVWCGVRAGHLVHLNIHDAVKADKLTPVEILRGYCEQIHRTVVRSHTYMLPHRHIC